MILALVTGATGMIGRHLVDVLREAGITVRVLVRPGSDARFLEERGIEVRRGSMSDRALLRRVVEGVDFVFHTAGYVTAGAPFGAAENGADGDWPLYQSVNIDFTEALLEASCAQGVKRFLFVSSSSVYAAGVPVPTGEDEALAPASAYGRSKMLAEEAVRAAQDWGLATTIIRPSLTFGPGDRYFTPLALRLSRLPVLPLVNGGQALMDLIYVRDVAELLWCAARQPAADGRVYNAGPGRPTSLAALVAAFRQVTGRGPRILAVSPDLAARTARFWRLLAAPLIPEARSVLSPQGLALMNRDIHLSMERAARELGFRPSYDLMQGLELTINGQLS